MVVAAARESGQPVGVEEVWVSYSAAAAELGMSVPRFHVLAVDEGLDIRVAGDGREGAVSRSSLDRYLARPQPRGIKGLVGRVWRAVRWLP